MELDWKKIGIILLFIVAIALFGFFLYYFFFRSFFVPPTNANINTNANANGRLPLTVNINGKIYTVDANGQLPTTENVNGKTPATTLEPTTAPTNETELVSKDNAYFVSSSQNGELVYYDPKTGKFYRLSLDGKISEFSDKIFYNVKNVSWSNNLEKAVLEYPDGSNIVYDFKNKKQLTLPNHWEDFSFSPNDEKLVFKSLALDPENRFLAVANYDGSQSKTLERIGGVEDKFDSNWSPNNQMVATFTQGKDANRSEVYFIGLNNENFKLMIVEGRGFQGKWSPDGQRILYSVYSSDNDYKPELWISEATPGAIGENRLKLDLTTWANKCAFSGNDRLFCAVPINPPAGVGLDPEVANEVNDQIYEIDLRTGSKKIIANPDGYHSIGQLIISTDTHSLFFTDNNTKKIYKVKI
ncbi:MAG: hypothetical protein WC518_00320 [Patescibacteria group bacterium]